MTLTFNLTLLSVVIFMQQLLKMFVKICFFRNLGIAQSKQIYQLYCTKTALK